ncbi:MAG: AlbA family DNA-binding domain-containing protein, partial [Thermoplasmatota archaeon]
MTEGDLVRSILGPVELAEAGYQWLDVVLPDYRAKIEHLWLADGTFRVTCTFHRLAESAVEVRVVSVLDGKTREHPVEGTPHGFEAKIGATPELIQVFVVNLDGDEVVDWARVRPFNFSQPEGISIQIPREIVAKALLEGEGQHVEFKAGLALGKPEETLESVVAFANSGGGTILVGVEDDGAVCGLKAPEKDAQRLKDWCASGVDPHPKVEVARAVQEDKSILVVRVPDGSDKPYSCE